MYENFNHNRKILITLFHPIKQCFLICEMVRTGADEKALSYEW